MHTVQNFTTRLTAAAGALALSLALFAITVGAPETASAALSALSTISALSAVA